MKDNEQMVELFRNSDWAGIERCIAEGEWGANQPLTIVGGWSKERITLLSSAVGNGAVSLVRQLIQSGADVDLKVRGEEAPLLTACAAGHREIVELLLEAGVDVNRKSLISDEGDPGETPLMIAAQTGDREMIARLLEHGADIRAKTRRGRTALSLVIFVADINRDLVRLLLNSGCPVDGRDLHHPIYQRDLDVVEMLLASKPDVNVRYDWPTWVLSNDRGDTPLFVAVAKNGPEMLHLEKDIRPSARLSIIDLLIKAGADVNAQRGIKANGWTPLMVAAAQDEDEIARKLIDAGADPNQTIETRWIGLVDGCQKQRKGPLSAIGMAKEQPNNKKIRKLLLGHE